MDISGHIYWTSIFVWKKKIDFFKFHLKLNILINIVIMPYQLFKFGKNQYKVGIVGNDTMSNGRQYLSNEYLSRNQAVKQLYAVHIQEFGLEEGVPSLIIDKRHYNSPELSRKKKLIRGNPSNINHTNGNLTINPRTTISC
jgi:hypothetical protein